MGVTLGVLILLMFAIQGLGLFDRIVQRREAAAVVETAPAATTAPPAPAAATDERTPSGEIVAAIAAALAMAETESQVQRVLQSPPAGTSPDAWRQAGRQHLMRQHGRPSR